MINFADYLDLIIKVITILMITVKLPDSRTANPLSELCSNTEHLPYKFTTKRSLHTKKSLNLKLQKSRLDHCCVDIVHRKSNEQTANASMQQRASNIQLLKKQIEYLEQDRFNWEKFPKEDVLFKTAELKTIKRSQQPSPIIKTHSLNEVVAESSRSVLLEGLLNSFNKNFYIAPLERRPLTSDERRAKQYFTAGKKKSLRKCVAIDISGVDKQNLRKTIHSRTDLSTPFRKYFAANRTRRNSSCAAQIVGYKIKKHSLGTV